MKNIVLALAFLFAACQQDKTITTELEFYRDTKPNKKGT